MTADTDEFKPGDRATWMRVQRGGYGYVVPVPCTIEQLPEAGGRVRIRVVKADGVIAYRGVEGPPRQGRSRSNAQLGPGSEAN